METKPEFYDSKCLACHQPTAGREGGARPAAKGAENPAAPHPAGTKQCATCHMPKVELPGAHFQFTDHRIRIVKPGEAYPK